MRKSSTRGGSEVQRAVGGALRAVGNALCGVPRFGVDRSLVLHGTPQRAFPTGVGFGRDKEAFLHE